MSTMRNSNDGKQKIIVFIQGNISSGKSTLIRNLKAEGHVVYEEPVDKWLNEYKDESGTNSLELFYQNMKEHAFFFEMLVMRTRWEKIKEALRNESPLVFIERSFETDTNVFALNLFENKLMNPLQWRLYNELLQDKKDDVEHLFENVEVHQLYLRTDPNICFDRKYIRNRIEERSIPIEYFRIIHEKHDNWLTCLEKELENKTHIIDGNNSIEEVLISVRIFITGFLD